MAGDGDLKDQAINSSHDFYDLLGVPSTASESEIRRAYRHTALKYHPDKAGANDASALEKFHLLQIAYDVLLDTAVRQLYDNARRAREEKKERETAYEGRRKHLKEELERREGAAASGQKRKRDELHEEEVFQRELKRLAEDGARRRREREEQLRREAQEELLREENGRHGTPQNAASPAVDQSGNGVEDIDRMITLRFPASSPDAPDRDRLISQFSRFGKIDEVVLRDKKKIKIEGEKHRREYITAMIVFKSIVGAHAAVMDVPELAKSEDSRGEWGIFEAVGWAAGKEPEYIPKPTTPASKSAKDFETVLSNLTPTSKTPVVEKNDVSTGDGGLRKVPSFGSFKGSNTPGSATKSSDKKGAGFGSPSMEELTMIRLKNAERRRLIEKLKKEDAEAELARQT